MVEMTLVELGERKSPSLQLYEERIGSKRQIMPSMYTVLQRILWLNGRFEVRRYWIRKHRVQRLGHQSGTGRSTSRDDLYVEAMFATPPGRRQCCIVILSFMIKRSWARCGMLLYEELHEDTWQWLAGHESIQGLSLADHEQHVSLAPPQPKAAASHQVCICM